MVLVAGAGFDPRAQSLAGRLQDACRESVRALLVKEERPDPPQNQVERAESNTERLLGRLGRGMVVPIEIFGQDSAVVGGRRIVDVLDRYSLEGVTDIVVDISALSVGTSFPIVRYFAEHVAQKEDQLNLHLFVTHDPDLDGKIRSKPSDTPGYVHGFKGGCTLSSAAEAARLWLPQLATGRRSTLGMLYDFVDPHDTCPVLPFPARNPRLGDLLVEEYWREFESTWMVDTRNLVYADEADPLDLYRTILRLDNLRKPVFAEAGGSILVLSPLGSKVMAVGSLLASLDRDLPVAHIEPIGYEFEGSIPEEVEELSLIHIWLEGEVYPQPRPALPAGGSSPP